MEESQGILLLCLQDIASIDQAAASVEPNRRLCRLVRLRLLAAQQDLEDLQRLKAELQQQLPALRQLQRVLQAANQLIQSFAGVQHR